MQVNGVSIYMGAYAERNSDKFQFNQQRLVISEERKQEIAAGIKEAYNALNLQNRAVKATISQEDMDFLCSEEGFQKMKKDAGELYVANANRQKVIATGRNPEDEFWNNTGNQWLIFSESLDKNGFYSEMSDEDVKKFEDTLSYITFGMDCLSRSQYNTGIDFSSIDEEFKYFMTSAEATMCLESSTAALRYMADTLIPEQYRGEFYSQIDMYHTHNSEIISEYVNPMESFNKVISKVISDNVAPKPVDEYKYTVMLGKINKSESDRKNYATELENLFLEIKPGISMDGFLNEIKDKLAEYATNGEEDEGIRDYVVSEADYLFNYMNKVWGKLLGDIL